MLIAIISDIHDNLDHLNKLLVFLTKQKVAKIICGGDLGNQDTLNYLATTFTKEIILVKGNADLYDPSTLINHPHIKFADNIIYSKIENVHIAVCHEPEKIKDIQASTTNQPLDFIFYGHSHRAWIKTDGSTTIANPGSLSGPPNLATFALLNPKCKKLELRSIASLSQ